MKLVLFSFFVILSIVSGCDLSGIENTGNFGSSKNQGSRSGSNQSSNNPAPVANPAPTPTVKPAPVDNPAPKPAPTVNPAPVPATTVNPAPKSVVNPVPAASNPPKAPVTNRAPKPVVNPVPAVTPAPTPTVNPAPVPATTVNPAPKSVVNPVPAANNPTPGPVANSAPAIAPDAQEIVVNIFKSNDMLQDVIDYINSAGDKKTKAMELINAGILAKIFDNEALSEYGKEISVDHHPVVIITHLSELGDDYVNRQIIDEIKNNNYIKKLTTIDNFKLAFLDLLPDEIKNNPDIKKQIEIKKLFYQPIYSVINDFLDKNSKNDLEKTKLAIELIDEGLIANLFTILAQDILNETKLAFNDDIKNKIIEKIKNDKIIENISYKNYQNGNQFQFLYFLGNLPDYLLDDQDINNQIKMAICKNMNYPAGFEAIYNEFIEYKLVISEKIKDLALVPMALIFDNVMKKNDKNELVNKDFLVKTVMPLMKTKSAKDNFILFELLKDKFKNDASKNLFYKIIFELIFATYRGNLLKLNQDFDKQEFNRLKDYMTQFINVLTENDDNKKQIRAVKSLFGLNFSK